MKAVEIHFPPAITDALQDQYDATFVHLFGKVSEKTVKIECSLYNGVPQYVCSVPMFEKSLISKEDSLATKFPTEQYVGQSPKSDKNYVNARGPAIKRVTDNVEEAKKAGQISQDVRIIQHVDEITVVGSNIKDVVKVASEFYLAKHAPQYAIDYKKIIETGVDERTGDETPRTWADRSTQGGKDSRTPG